MQMVFNDDLDNLETHTVDMCPSCGILLDEWRELTAGCNDHLGCGAFLDEEEDEEEEDCGIEELNFD